MRVTGWVVAAPDAKPQFARVLVRDTTIERVESVPPPPHPDQPFICPAFIDAHTHPMELGLQELFADLSGAGSLSEVLVLLRGRLAAGRDAGTMLGFNLEPDRLTEQRYPTRTEIDSVVPDLPALVYRVDGHSAVTNTPGLGLLAGTRTSDGLDPEAGLLTGQAYERASRLFKSRLGTETQFAALDCASRAAARQGVATLAALVGNDDMAPAEWRGLVAALERQPVRMVPLLQTRQPELARELDQSRVGGCILIDGSLGSHTAALAEPYADRPDDRGLLYLTDDELARFIGESDRLGLQTMVHAIGDRAVEQVVRVHERLGTGARGNPLRHRVEHAILLPGSLVERIAAQRLLLGIQPAFEAWWGGPDRLYARRLGSRRLRTNPWRELRDAGVLLAGGSDAPITPIDPLAGIRAATAHPNPEQRLGPAAALDLFTAAAAYSLGLEANIGRLEPGLQADLVVLDADPRAGGDARVFATLRAGRVIHGSVEGNQG